MLKKPNVIFVLTDDQGYPPLGAHGHPFIETPNLDSFHASAVRFEQFHSGTTCAPTRAGLLTGHHCNSTGVWHTIGGRSLLRRDEWTLADALRENGYRTGIFGKWHLGDEFPYRPQDRGFDRSICHGGGGISQQPDWWGNDYFDDTYLIDGEPRSFTGYCTDLFFAEAMKFIESSRDRPFFCYISTNAPHSPFNVEPEYRDRYLGSHTESEAYARFLGMITNIDDNFGRLRETIKRLELEENTILVFMSDNGQTGVGDPTVKMYNSYMRGMKGSPYEGGHRIPFLLRWPDGGFADAATIGDICGYVDFMPTLLDLCGVPVPVERSFHGESLVALMRGSTDAVWRNRTFVTDTQRIARPVKWRMSCVMKGDWRLVNRDELYDLSRDPGQRIDIASDYPEVVSELRDVYEAWWEICSRQMDNDIPVSIGAEGREEAILRTHDLRNELDAAVVWNQEQVRKGTACSGYWELFVERDGIYEFELRRWPKEAGHAVSGGVEGDDVEYRRDAIAPGSEGYYSGGVALAVDLAVLDVSGFPQRSARVGSDDRGVSLRIELPRGPRHVRARLGSCNGSVFTSAYYVYVRRVGG